MYRVLIADDDYEDRELLKLEISRALEDQEDEIRFYEAPSINKALDLLKSQNFDLLTLDIEFDRLNEGIEALPGIFEAYPTLNIIVISGKLSKAEVTEQLFRFTKDNLLKGKRWARHFDVLDKKDDKTAPLRRAYEFALGQTESVEKIRELLLLAERHLEDDDYDKCMGVYQRIQDMAPHEAESRENLRALKGEGFEQALDHLRRGERIAGALLLGHHIENRLKNFTRKTIGRHSPGLYDCLKDMEKAKRISPYKKTLFQQLLRIRNKAVHHPDTTGEDEFEQTRETLLLLESKF